MRQKIGAEDCPYFRTQEFSNIMLEGERLIKKFAGAPEGARVVFITGSGTASMEATIMNVLMPQGRVFVVNGDKTRSFEKRRRDLDWNACPARRDDRGEFDGGCVFRGIKGHTGQCDVHFAAKGILGQ